MLRDGRDEDDYPPSSRSLSDGGDEVYHPPSSGSFLVPHSPRIEEAREKGLKHFRHPHPLTFKEGFEDEVFCDACGLEIGRSGGFSCCMEECSFFNLHEFCASLPREMEDYPQHSKHSLILYTRSPSFRESTYQFNCGVCDTTSSTQFCYHCELCEFDVDLRCASMSINLICNPIIHKHEIMTAQLHHSSFLCCLCGEIHRELGFSYQCKTCWFLIHEQCYSLPQNIKHDSHVHPLELYHIPTAKYFIYYLCGICEENINKNLGFYICKRCKYSLHIKCLAKKWDSKIETLEDQINDKLIQFPLSSSEAVRSTLAQFIKNICHSKDDGEYKDGDILNHPSHDHPLILESDLSKFTNFNYSSSSKSIRNYEVCNGCILPLLDDASFYSCNRSTCNFILHKWCSNLPSELQHPAHTGHTLILQEKLDESFGFFRCKGCGEIGNGFAYKCNECKSYYLDVRCAALPKQVIHETDKHPLILKYGRSIGGCFSCGQSNFYEEREIFKYSSTISNFPISYFTYGCDACNLSIHPKCLILPREIVHWYDEHRFKLTDSTKVFTGDQLADSTRYYVSYDDNPSASTYHCEFCEKTRYMRGWIYHCIECDQCVDTECVRNLLGLFPLRIKYGGLIYDSRLHQHPLTCISRKGFVCNLCNNEALFCDWFGIGFECTECKIEISLECALFRLK